jgi:hypothetical protein
VLISVGPVIIMFNKSLITGESESKIPCFLTIELKSLFSSIYCKTL